MALVGSGAISLNAVNVELGLTGTTQISMNDTIVRTLFGKASGAISMSDGYGKSSRTSPELYTTPGTSNFVVPTHSTITVSVWGGGGGSGDSEINVTSGYGILGGNGGTSSFGSYLTATGGQRTTVGGSAGVPGSGSGGDINESGQSGSVDYYAGPDRQVSLGGAAGGLSYGGGAAVYSIAYLFYANGDTDGTPGNSYGGGAAAFCYNDGGNGGGLKNILSYPGGSGGGFTRKTWSSGVLTPGSTISVTVGAGGAAGAVSYFGSNITSSAGAAGAVLISWT